MDSHEHIDHLCSQLELNILTGCYQCGSRLINDGDVKDPLPNAVISEHRNEIGLITEMRAYCGNCKPL